MVAAAAASVLCCMGAVFPATIGVTAASADEPVELVVNGGFEDDLNGWKSGTVWNSSASSIAVTADDVHGGSGALSVTDRTSSDAGAIQSLDGKVEKGQTYTGSMWVKATEDGEFNITVCSGNGSGCDQIATGTAKAGEWTQISGTGTLGGSGDFTSPSLVIENKYGTSNAQIILRWHIQAGNIVIPGSKNPVHIKDNFNLFDFALTDDEMAKITALDKQKRYYTSTPEMLKKYAEMVPPVDEQK